LPNGTGVDLGRIGPLKKWKQAFDVIVVARQDSIDNGRSRDVAPTVALADKLPESSRLVWRLYFGTSHSVGR